MFVSRSAGWTNVLQDDLIEMRSELESEAKQLQQDRGKQERLATTVTNQQQADAQVTANDCQRATLTQS